MSYLQKAEVSYNCSVSRMCCRLHTLFLRENPVPVGDESALGQRKHEIKEHEMVLTPHCPYRGTTARDDWTISPITAKVESMLSMVSVCRKLTFKTSKFLERPGFMLNRVYSGVSSVPTNASDHYTQDNYVDIDWNQRASRVRFSDSTRRSEIAVRELDTDCLCPPRFKNTSTIEGQNRSNRVPFRRFELCRIFECSMAL